MSFGLGLGLRPGLEVRLERGATLRWGWLAIQPENQLLEELSDPVAMMLNFRGGVFGPGMSNRLHRHIKASKTGKHSLFASVSRDAPRRRDAGAVALIRRGTPRVARRGRTQRGVAGLRLCRDPTACATGRADRVPY